MAYDDADDDESEDSLPASLAYPEQRLRRADRLMRKGPEGRREAMLIYRDLADVLAPEEPRDAARVAAIAATPATVDAHFESLFGRLAAASPDPVQRALALVAAGRIAAQRGDFHRAEAGVRRAIRQGGDADKEVESLHLLTIVWLTQGREHEGLAAATASLNSASRSPVADVYRRSHLVGARVAAEDWDGALQEAAAWQSACERVEGEPSLHSVALHASHACVRRGDADGARAWLARIRTDEAEPAHAEVLRPVVTLRTAQIAAATGAAVRAADLAASVARNQRNELRTRADAIALAVEFLCASGATLRAAGFVEEWAKLVASQRDRLGTGIAIRHSVSILTAVLAASEADPQAARTPLLRQIAGCATDAIADRVEELVRHLADREVPPLPPGDETLTRFRRARAARLAILAAPAVAVAASANGAVARIAATIGSAPVVCPACLCVERPDADGIPARLPVGHLVAHLPATRVADSPCAACAKIAQPPGGGRRKPRR